MLKDIKEKVQQVVKEVARSDEFKSSDSSTNPFANIEPSSVLLETRCFKENPIVPTKCANVVAKILYLLCQGQRFTEKETSDLFFSITQLFQSPHEKLRRLLYLLIKTLDIHPSEVFIVTSSLVKDMNSGVDCYCANAIRVLAFVVDASLAVQMERHIKSALVHGNPFVASCALIYANRLLRVSPEVVRRWTNEIAEGLTSNSGAVQLQSVLCLSELKRNDRLALSKMLTDLTQKLSSLKAVSEMMVIRLAAKMLLSARDPTIERVFMPFLESRLRTSRNDIAVLEAAKGIVSLAISDTQGHGTSLIWNQWDVSTAVTCLAVHLASPMSPIRFAAIRQLSLLAQVRPQAVARMNSDIDLLLTDPNKNIGTLALFTLLKTGQESSVERLMRQIQNFIGEVSEAFKIEVVRVVQRLASQYPSKQKHCMNFLSTQLRDEGTPEFKKSTAETIMALVEEVPSCRESAVAALCEFIEDCESNVLCARILAFLGHQAAFLSNPGQCVRYMYNRLILENAIVRSAGVDALAHVAQECPYLRKNIAVLLDAALVDQDDEVRVSAALYMSCLEKVGNEEDGSCLSECSTQASSLSSALDTSLPVALEALADHMTAVYEAGDASGESLIDLSSLPTQEAYDRMCTHRRTQPMDQATPGTPLAVDTSPTVHEEKASASVLETLDLDTLATNMGLPSPGQLKHASAPQMITEEEAEYSIEVVKYMLSEPMFLLLEFRIRNTLEDQVLDNVHVQLTPIQGSTKGGRMNVIGGFPSSEPIRFDETKSSFVLLKKETFDTADALVLVQGSLGVTLHFTVKEQDDDIGFKDEYAVEPLAITVADYLSPRPLRPGEFRSAWQGADESNESVTKLSFGRTFSDLQAAVHSIVRTLHLAPCDHTDEVDASETQHLLQLSGFAVGSAPVFVRAGLAHTEEMGVIMKCAVRSTCITVSRAVVAAFE